MDFRRATEHDIPAITRIYNEGIEDRLATLETEPRTEEERLEWLRGHDDRHRVFVAVEGLAESGTADGTAAGQVVGWASLNVFNPRPAYSHVADFSVYVARGRRSRGVGTFLLEHLLREATRLGFHKLVLAAFPFNEEGMALYTKMGFRTVGVYKEQAQLDGRWVDVIVMEKLL